MVTEVVVDSSVIVALSIPEELSEWALKKISEYEFPHILEFCYYEVANAIKCKTPRLLDTKRAEKAFNKALDVMNQFGVHSFGEVIVDAFSLGLELNIAVYDAAFVVLADKLDMRLLTLDLRLAKRLEGTKYGGLIDCPARNALKK
jgi:predicted nucleic acid-binding protein